MNLELALKWLCETFNSIRVEELFLTISPIALEASFGESQLIMLKYSRLDSLQLSSWSAF